MRLEIERPAPVGNGAACGDDAPRHTAASISRLAGDEAHRLGNLLIALTFCLKHLRGRQRTQELEEMVERGFQDAERGVEAMRQYMQATHVLLHMAKTRPG